MGPSRELPNLYAEMFIARSDVKAIQRSNGAYNPVKEPFTRKDIEAHLAGRPTYGHYLLNVESQCKLITFDIDFQSTGTLPTNPEDPDSGTWESCNPREIWRQRDHACRPLMKSELRTLSGMIARRVFELLNARTAVAYSGNKGVHVYAFTGLMPAEDQILAAKDIILADIGDFEPQQADNFYVHKDFPNLSVEVFPKQATISKDGFGNLCRLPLGRNLKSSDPTFFVDLRAPMNQLKPRDAFTSLTVRDPWSD